jgi:uncharacterized protein (TIGR02118 family)
MASMIVLYGRPDDPAAFEDYYAHRHIPYATEHMPNVTGAHNQRVIGAPGAGQPPLYRISEMTYDNAATLHEALASEGGRAVLADLDNFATGGATVLLADD